jgi:V/A-type H+-transporting ATPase subunit I
MNSKVIKVNLFLKQEELNSILKEFQKFDIFMIDKSHKTTNIKNADEQKLIYIEKQITTLRGYRAPKSKNGYLEIDYSRLDKFDGSGYEFGETCYNNLKNIDFLNNEITKLKSNINELKDELDKITPFKDLNIPTNLLSKLQYVEVKLGRIKKDPKVNSEDIYKDICEYSLLSETDDYSYLAVLFLKDNRESALNHLKNINFLNYDVREYTVLLSERIEEINTKIIESNELILKHTDYLVEQTAHLDDYYIYYDYLLNVKYRQGISAISTNNSVYIKGYIGLSRKEEFEGIVKNTLSSYEIEYLEKDKEEKLPTLLVNNKFVKQFEFVTNIYSSPNSDELDPNPIMSIWYFIIMGIMVGDIGYGIIMSLLTYLFIKFKKPKGGTKQLMTMFFYGGFISIFFGLIFGSFMGYKFDLLNVFNKNWHIKLIDPMDDLLLMLILCVGLGLLHIICGLALKVRADFINKQYLDGISGGISWILVLTGVIVGVIGFQFIQPLIYVGIVLAGIGLLLILFLSGHSKKGFGKVSAGLGGIYGITSYLGDALSYSRILAICLSGASIASTMDLLTGMIMKQNTWYMTIIGIVAGVLVFIAGHALNFASGMLGTFVHSARLQYIEFYGKFYQGGGYLFDPITIQNRYVNNVSVNTNLKGEN